MSFAALVDSVTNFRPKRRSLLKAGAVLLYGMVVFGIVFAVQYYVRQADDLARKAVADLKGVTVEFSSIEPQLFPPRLTLDFLRVFDGKTKKPILLMKDTDLRLAVLPLFVGKVALSVEGRMYGGLVNAKVSTGSMLDMDWISADVKLDMVELEKIPQMRAYDKSLKGFALIETTFEGNLAAPETLTGEFYAKLDQLDMENRYPVVKGPRLKGFTVNFDCGLKDGLLTVRDLDVKDQTGISLKTDGTVTLDPANFMKSTLALEGKFTGPVARFAVSVLGKKAIGMLKKKQSVKVMVGGSVEQPKVEM